jgi:NADP-dependent 3-hydroxy acid dehydrogenase YdfG
MTAFQDRVSVVTGAGSGVGEAVALSLAEQGATVCLVERQLKALGDRCIIIRRADSISTSSLSDRSNPGRRYQVLISGLRADFRQIDIVIHSAGVFSAVSSRRPDR